MLRLPKVLRVRRLALVAMGALAVAVAGAAHSASAAAVAAGGTYRTAVSSFGLTDNLDPTGEYQTGFAWEIYAATLRTLVSYNRTVGVAGTTLHPDLAMSVPKPANGGLTYTFHLKKGVRFGPPVNRPVTSKDILFAFQRINAASLTAQYGFYFDGVVKGMTGKAKSLTAPISGISTPNASTIVFHLTQRTGDFLYRLALPATAPIPPEVGKCFAKSGTYGRDLVSTGPYMLKGADEVKTSSCGAIKPMSGYDPTDHITLVRSPTYNASTDTKTMRANRLNGVEVTIDSNAGDIFNRIKNGELDGSMFDPPPAVVVHSYLRDASLRSRLHSTPIMQTESLTMNLAIAPFNDVHVRKAVAWVLDRAAIQAVLGGATTTDLATHILPPVMLQNRLGSYNPFTSAGGHGDLGRAQAEMKHSPYDTNKDGKCDVGACKNVVLINAQGQFTAIDPIVQNSLLKIGIQVTPRNLETGAAFTAIETVKNKVPMSALGGGYADYADGYGLIEPLFGSSALAAVGCCNYTWMGLTKQKAQSLGIPYPANGVPSLDGRIAKCEKLNGTPRANCWAGIDRYLTGTLVPYVPYMWGRKVDITAPDVTRYVVDQATGAVSLTQIAVSNHVNP